MDVVSMLVEHISPACDILLTTHPRLPLALARSGVQMHILGEIVSASHFEYDDLYVHMLLDLPDGWKLSEGYAGAAWQDRRVV